MWGCEHYHHPLSMMTRLVILPLQTLSAKKIWKHHHRLPKIAQLVTSMIVNTLGTYPLNDRSLLVEFETAPSWWSVQNSSRHTLKDIKDYGRRQTLNWTGRVLNVSISCQYNIL